MILSLLIGAAFVAGTILSAFAVYWIMRRLIGPDHPQHSKDLAGSVIFRVSALHGLILALVFAQELYDYTTLREDLVDEATAAADIFNDLARHGSDAALALRPVVGDYVREVAGPEWVSLSRDDRLTDRGWRLRERLYVGALDLSVATPREVDLRDHIIVRAQAIAMLRQAREATALNTLSPLFWIAAVAGTLAVFLPYFIYPSTRLNLMLLSIYGGFTGLVMFIIYAFSDPFANPGRLQPIPFERLLETEIGRT